jgi:hypothetical protein
MDRRPQHIWCNREAVQPVLVKAVVVVLVLVPVVVMLEAVVAIQYCR